MGLPYSWQQTGHGSTFEPGDIGLDIVELGGGKITSPVDQLAYIVSAERPGRKIRFTLHNASTDRHQTYQVETARGPVAAGEGRRRFVSVLTGPYNEGDYTYFGTIFDRGAERVYGASAILPPPFPLWKAYGGHRARSARWHYYLGKKSKIGSGAVSARAFLWLWCSLISGKSLPEGVQFWHQGTCGRCGRSLTDPESITRGLGPICAGKAAN